MAFSAVLDANVLYPASLRDTLLRFASRDVFVPVCTDRILDEVERNVVADGRVTQANAARLRAAMTRVFEDAWIDDEAIRGLETAMTNNPKTDTSSLRPSPPKHRPSSRRTSRDSRPARSRRTASRCNHPDELLLGLTALHPSLAVEILRAQAAALTRPPLTVHDVLDALSMAGVPEFAAAIRARIGPI